MVHIYTGNGKGKTTCALGLIIRAMGHQKKVCLIQFMKGDWRYGEITTLQKLSGIDIFKFGTEDFVDPSAPRKIDFQQAAAGCEKAEQVLKQNSYDLVVLDEINVAVFMKLLPLEKQLLLMDSAGNTELVMTGRYANPEVIARADLVTEMLPVKHYFDQGVTSRQGIEF
jgi:cob(I)alamin adenosyltransferase